MSNLDKTNIKLCVVCGDKALANNFGALTCQPCKAFFRRNALRNQETFICHFNDKCKIDSLTRRFCKKCRLVKCFAIGMRKELILSESKKQFFRYNSNNRSETNNNKTTALNTTTASDSTKLTNNANNDKHNYMKMLLNSYEDFNETNSLSLDSFINWSTFSTQSNCTDIAIHRPINDYKNNFNDIEVNKLTELVRVMNTIRTEGATQQVVNILDPEHSLQLLFTDRVKSVTKISQYLTAFSELCVNDQISLVKYGCIEILSMRSIELFDYNNYCWNIKSGNVTTVISLDVIQNNAKKELYYFYRQFFQKLRKEYNSDPNIMDLLTAIILFSPNRPNLIHRDTIKFQQKIYIYLMQRYIRLKYSYISEIEANSKFSRLMSLIMDLYNLGHLVKKDSMSRDSETYAPLLRDIFDKDNDINNQDFSLYENEQYMLALN